MLSFTPSPERFIVEEIAAYPPRGEGEHTFLWVEKRGLTTFDAISAVALALGVPPRDVGYAGMKDRHATTRQWLSVPKADPEAAQAIRRPELTVLAAARHPHKLRLGHLRANRFEVVLTGAASDDEMQALRARFAELAARGVPNRFGDQRFGGAGDNAARGLALLRGERRERDKRKRRLLLSAVQSAVFNRALELRAAAADGFAPPAGAAVIVLCAGRAQGQPPPWLWSPCRPRMRLPQPPRRRSVPSGGGTSGDRPHVRSDR